MTKFRGIILFILVTYVSSVFFFSCRTGNANTPPATYFERITDSISQKYGYTKDALHFLDSLYSNYPKADLESRFYYYTYACAYYRYAEKNSVRAMLYADSMLLLVHNNTDVKNYDKLDAIANISKGDILYVTNDYNSAYQYYYLGKIAAEKSLDPCTYSEYSYRLGMAMYKKNSYNEAAVYFNQAFKESSSCKEQFSDFYRRQELLNNTALSYKKSGQTDSAMAYYNKTLAFIDSQESMYPGKKALFEIARGVVYGNLAQVYATTKYIQAEALYKKSININSKPGNDNNDALLTQMHLAHLYMGKQKTDSLYNTLMGIKNGLDTINNTAVKTEWNQLMWQYYDRKKDITNAYTYLKTYDTLNGYQFTNNQKLDEIDVNGKLKSLESEYQMNLLKKDYKLNQLYFVVSAALFLMAAVILLLFHINFKKSKKNVQALTQLNDKINKQKEQLEKTLGELENRNKEKDRILGIVAHDLRNPITAISSLMSILEDDNRYTEDQQQIHTLIQNACTNSLELINEILEFAIDDSSRKDVPLELVDINLIANNCVKMMRFKAAEKKQKLQLQASDTPELIKANPSKIWRVLSNLVTNAVKFSPSGAIIKIKISNADGRVQASVQDKGIGIPDAIKNKIFDTHTSAIRPGTQGEKPFGLGLSICKQIVEAYEGRIWFETNVGNGTTFYISLPKQEQVMVEGPETVHEK